MALMLHLHNPDPAQIRHALTAMVGIQTQGLPR
jgi:hypothetical protein